MTTRPYFRFTWSHFSPIHRTAVRMYNAFMRCIPFSIKYGLGKQLRSQKPPYCLITPGTVVVQIGAPRDTLMAGRSRGMYFSVFAGHTGTAMIIEPDPANIAYFEAVIREQGIQNVILCQIGAWSEQNILKLYINDRHPATNLTEVSAKRVYTEKQLRRFRIVDIPVNTIDNILAEHHIAKVDLISITTNGSEEEILEGMGNLMAAGLPYIALAGINQRHRDLMKKKGYRFYAYDDRGMTFLQNP
ncbi:FkbM family methyltransferase [candidate division KSB3 bacterium]|uniref:FkbM family methyltransferase n=1 Tax=candidate division KSB3 bacterium TaxID=2044937 RepID=A0A9D5JTK5_9BACT|nr:FkbM family methyltransferase [candidate division KSB3 bacterium]MBD3323854.1 FkbM family methyltransferase [candidate division KSB3 bacterium]